MLDDRLTRCTGALAAVGGAGWALAGFLLAALDGCTSPACPATVMGDESAMPTLIVLFAVALVFVAAAGIGLALVAVRLGALRVPGAVAGAIGALACAVGIVCVAAAGVLNLDGGDMAEGSGTAVALGVSAIVAGLSVVGCVLLGVRGRSRAVGAFVLLGIVLLASALDQPAHWVLLVVPCGMCWCGAGSLLLGARDQRPAPRRLSLVE
jgi:hypothetical protein